MHNYYDTRKIRDLKELLYTSEKMFSKKAAFLYKPQKERKAKYQEITYQQFKNDVNALGTALISLGLKDENIAVIGENRYEWNTSYLAVVCGTGTVVPIDKELPANEIVNLLNRSNAKAIIYSGKKQEEIKEAIDKCKDVEFFINMDSTEDSEKTKSYTKLLQKGKKLLENDKSFVDAEINPEAPLIMLFTSGTTSNSKAVLLCHRNIVSNIMNLCKVVYADENDVFLSFLPLHHTYECTCNFLAPIYLGSTIAFCDGLRHIAKNLKEASVTVLITVPLLLEAIYWKMIKKVEKQGKLTFFKIASKINSSLLKLGINVSDKLFKDIYEAMGGNLRLLVSGAAALDPLVSKGFKSLGIQCIQGYGLTECSPIVSVESDKFNLSGSTGRPLPQTDVKINDENENRVGEICVKGPSLMLGYLNEENNKRAFDKDGYFKTGDIGYIDNNGYLFISGRKKNVIVTKNGKNIFPEEIETLILRCPLIKECLVYGLEDEVSGDETVSVKIVPDEEYIASQYPNGLSEDKLSKMLNDEVKKVNKSLVNYKAVKKVFIQQNEFKKTTTHKIKRYLET